MRVRELIDMLADHDPNANVFVMSQPSWPFEVRILGVTSRYEFSEEDSNSAADPRGISPSDVFIVEGSQIRYGDRGAWETVRRM